MNIDQIQDIKELKALWYDEMRKHEIAGKNLQVLNNRIIQLEQAERNKPQTEKQRKVTAL